jgi:hypothetical protein
MENGNETQALVRSDHQHPPADRSIQLGDRPAIDLSGLSDAQVAALKIKHAESIVAVNERAQSVVVDANAVNAKLAAISKHAMDVSAEGLSVSITVVKDDSRGRIEAMIGNSDAAKSGKLTRSQTGAPDRTILFAALAAGAVLLLLVIALIAKH